MFEGPRALYNYYLQFNQIETLHVKVFPILYETVRIRLDYNSISTIERRAFYDGKFHRKPQMYLKKPS